MAKKTSQINKQNKTKNNNQKPKTSASQDEGNKYNVLARDTLDKLISHNSEIHKLSKNPHT